MGTHQEDDMGKDKSKREVEGKSGKLGERSAGGDGGRDDPQPMVVEFDVDGLRSMGIMISGQGVVIPVPKPREPIRIMLKVEKLEVNFNREREG
ncbi:MAG: hypothetical protein BGP25_00545 [Lysobacterales bacterium 63-13]|nr:MAG: hypothetical protein BGP25_00545 [Xanthomonadales bacterium 63-13]